MDNEPQNNELKLVSPAEAVIRWQCLELPFIDEAETSDEASATYDESAGKCASGRFELNDIGDFVLGRICIPIGNDLRAGTKELFTKIFDSCKERELVRIWSIIPAVNKVVDGVENYGAFCAGRADAYKERYGDDYLNHAPASSAVGGKPSCLDVYFIATNPPVKRLNNPEQPVPSEMAAALGNIAPLFSRAAMCRSGKTVFAFVSGTCPDKDYYDASNMLWKQCASTVDNLKIMEKRLVEEGLGQNYIRHVNVFIRRREETLFILDYLARNWTRMTDRVRIHCADICRPEFALEVEFTAVSA